MQKEPTYRIRNWPEYNRTLIQRGRITVWIDEKPIPKQYKSPRDASNLSFDHGASIADFLTV